MQNIPRSVLRRRQFLRAGGTVALGAVSTVLAGRKFYCPPPSSGPVVSAPDPLVFPRGPRAELRPESDAPEQIVSLADPSVPLNPGDSCEAPRPLDEEDEYADFLSSLDLRYLSPEEIITPHRGVVRGVCNELPPKRLWERLAPTLRVADELRDRLGVPLQRITSAYRCPRYNLRIPGAVRNSYHTRNQALDLVFSCPTRKVVAMTQQLRSERFFRGGIGIYPYFIHIDTRGYGATWRG